MHKASADLIHTLIDYSKALLSLAELQAADCQRAENGAFKTAFQNAVLLIRRRQYQPNLNWN